MSVALSEQAIGGLVREFAGTFPAEAASELEHGEDSEVVALLAQLPPETAGTLLLRMSAARAQRLLEQGEPRAFAPMLEVLDPSKVARLLARLDQDRRTEQLKHLSADAAKEVEELVRYPADSAGALMDARVMAFRPRMKVEEVLVQLRQLPQKRAVEIFLVDEQGLLVGGVPLQELVIAKPEQHLAELTGPAPAAVAVTASLSVVVEALGEADRASVVVVDIDGVLLGVIRRDALIRAARKDAIGDMQAMVGASKEERALSRTSFAVKKRLPWLVVNLGTAFLAAAVVGLFESTISKFTALAVLLPVVAGQSGNTGAQALAVTMRGLALREVRVRQAWKVGAKELRVAFINGLGIAVITAAAVYLWSRSAGLMLVIGVSMVLSMTAAGAAGAAIPMILTALRQDPAQSSSIVLTTVTDVVGFFSFLGIATALSSML